MHHKSTSELRPDGMHSKSSVMFTSHIFVQNWGGPLPLAMQVLLWESVLPMLLRSLKPELAVSCEHADLLQVRGTSSDMQKMAPWNKLNIVSRSEGGTVA